MSEVMIKVGCDPELFVMQNGVFLSAHNLIPGTKNSPYRVPNGAVQVDGTALEFNIDPATNLKEFLSNINSVMGTLSNMVQGHDIVISPVANFESSYFRSLPRVAKELGCEPDYNAWTCSTNPRPDSKKPMRTASGHVHVGWTEGKDVDDYEHFDSVAKVMRELDYYLGVVSLDWDKDNTRRTLYGKAGAFRCKTYGGEYRVLSNKWLDNDVLKTFVYNQTIAGTNSAFSELSLQDQFGDLARHIIDNNIVDWRQEFPDLGEVLAKVA